MDVKQIIHDLYDFSLFAGTFMTNELMLLQHNTFHKDSERRVMAETIMSRDGELHVQDPDSRQQPNHKHLTRTTVTLIAMFAL